MYLRYLLLITCGLFINSGTSCGFIISLAQWSLDEGDIDVVIAGDRHDASDLEVPWIELFSELVAKADGSRFLIEGNVVHKSLSAKLSKAGVANPPKTSLDELAQAAKKAKKPNLLLVDPRDSVLKINDLIGMALRMERRHVAVAHFLDSMPKFNDVIGEMGSILRYQSTKVEELSEPFKTSAKSQVGLFQMIFENFKKEAMTLEGAKKLSLAEALDKLDEREDDLINRFLELSLWVADARFIYELSKSIELAKSKDGALKKIVFIGGNKHAIAMNKFLKRTLKIEPTATYGAAEETPAYGEAVALDSDLVRSHLLSSN